MKKHTLALSLLLTAPCAFSAEQVAETQLVTESQECVDCQEATKTCADVEKTEKIYEELAEENCMQEIVDDLRARGYNDDAINCDIENLSVLDELIAELKEEGLDAHEIAQHPAVQEQLGSLKTFALHKEGQKRIASLLPKKEAADLSQEIVEVSEENAEIAAE